MKFQETKIVGTYIIENCRLDDERGDFLKVYHEPTFSDKGIDPSFKEVFFSISHKDVIRGMHFQNPPHQHAKLIYIPHGSVIDVVLDIRRGSATYGEFMAVELSRDNCRALFLPEGCAHGFLSLEDDTNVTYLQTSVYSPDADTGVRWDSFGMNWPVSNPIVSKRDQLFEGFPDFNSPFSYAGAVL